MLGDQFYKKWWEQPEPNPWVMPPQTVPTYPIIPFPEPKPEPKKVKVKKKRKLTQEIIDDFVELLEAAKKYDAETGQKDCELDEKKEKIKKMVEDLGYTIEFP